MHKLTIREAAQSDTAAIHEIHVASIKVLCASTYAPEEIIAWSSNPDVERYARQMNEGRKFLLAMEDDNICGFGALDFAKREIAALFVHPDYAGHDIGAALLYALEAAAAALGISELAVHSSLNARRFYEKHGYGNGAPEKFRLRTGLLIDAVQLKKQIRVVD